MELKKLFSRIGFTEVSFSPDLTTLQTVHRLYVMRIPFENLSIHCGEHTTTNLLSIYQKIVLEGRGGWCCENNLLFSWVLKEMGYKFITLSSRVFNSLINDFGDRNSHLINLVEIDGQSYVADVSFGVASQIWWPLELIAGKDQPQPAGVFRLLNDGEKWILEKTGRKPLIQNVALADSGLLDKRRTKPVYSFLLTPRELEHFVDTSEFLQTSPESLFTQKSICSLQTPTGFRVLVGWTYSEVLFKPDEDVDLINNREVPDCEIETLLREKFNIILINKLQPKNEKVAYII